MGKADKAGRVGEEKPILSKENSVRSFGELSLKADLSWQSPVWGF